jgi:hypothetical protein
MTTDTIKSVLTPECLATIFPKERTNDFFEALFGDADEGAYDIELAFREYDGSTLIMELLLHERPNCCLACNLTQGLPQVFSRHPVINITGIVRELDAVLGDRYICGDWSLGYTEQHSNSLHAIPIKIAINKN